MDIEEIVDQPGSNQLMWAYQPIAFTVMADSVVLSTQPMYCDVYFYSGPFGLYYYKTLSSYSSGNDGSNSYFQFDIQDAVQEFLTGYLANQLLPMSTLVQASNLYATGFFAANNAVECLCRFRGSTFDGDGLLVPNATVPVQATATSDPESGTGTNSNAFYVVNATRKPLQNSDLEHHLQTLRCDSFESGGNVNSVYPLSNQPKNSYNNSFSSPLAEGIINLNYCIDSYSDDYGAFPFYVKEFGFARLLDTTVLNPYSRTCQVMLQFADIGGNVQQYNIEILPTNVVVTPGVWYLPVGQADILPMLLAMYDPGVYPQYFFNYPSNVYYSLVFYDIDAAGAFTTAGINQQQVLTTPWFKIQKTGFEKQRIWFQNAFGCFEQVNFQRTATENKTTSSESFRPLSAPNSYGLMDITSGRRRFNVRSSDTIMVSGIFDETVMPWLQELFSSAVTYLQVPDPEGALVYGGGPAGLLPVQILDNNVEVISEEERFQYMVTLKLRPQWDYIQIRN